MAFACALGAAAFLGPAWPLAAQVDPSVRWETLRTKHFRVHFNPPLETEARRAAVNAERAYAALARELVPPRGTIDLVVADNVDITNGQATPFPSNRIIVYAHPPVDATSLRYYGDWNALVIQHELTHIFHLDRARGWWRVAQHIVGRNPVVMPNLYTPAWLTEGLAVYYESRLTGFGRLAGTAHRTIADAAARDSALPRLDQLSLIAPEWPNGDGPYVYGSLLFSYLSATRGPATVPGFVEQSSAAPIPYFLDRVAHAAFGISFEQAWRQWCDSVQRASAHRRDEYALPLRTLTRDGYDAFYPRWIDSATLVYAANTERDLPGAYAVNLAGHDRRLDRRNGTDPNQPVPGGLVYSQLDFTSPYVIRTDLYRSRDGRDVRLTHGARLSAPDARAGGEIVAVWAHGATTQLALVSADGRHVIPITPFSLDTQWSEPRWSPDGRRIAAVRWERGAYMSIVILDTTGTVAHAYLRERAVVASPAWAPDGQSLVFTSDRTGRAEVYQVKTPVGASAETATPQVVRLGGAGARVSNPAISPDGARLAVSTLRGDGYHIAVGPYDTTAAPAEPADSSVGETPPIAPVVLDTTRATRFRPWSGLIPRYWMPVIGLSDQGYIQIGAFTSAYDVLRRHAYELQGLYNLRRSTEPELSASYEFRGFGQPLVDVGAQEFWTHERVADLTGVTVGTLVHRTVTVTAAATLLRPRVRTYAAWTLGAQWEARAYHTDPRPLIVNVDPFYASRPTFPSLYTVAGWSNVQVPALSISPEDGVSLRLTARQRWQVAASRTVERSAVGVADVYRALDLPGFAHHVIAGRLAVGLENDGAISTFTAGGRSGQTLEVVPGVTVGDQPRDFGVRGFPVGAARGTRALAASLEYRAPLWAPGRGWHLLPVFLGKTSVSVFADGAEAWCPTRGAALPGVCQARDAQRRLLSSVGAELNFDTSLQYDVPYRLRLGVAAPTSNRLLYGAAPIDFYITFGLPF